MLLKSLVHALIICAVLNLAAPLVTGPGFSLVLNGVSAGYYLLFSVSVSAGLHNRKELALTTYVIACIASYPDGIQELSHLTIPVGVGVLVGMASRNAITQPEKHHEQRFPD